MGNLLRLAKAFAKAARVFGKVPHSLRSKMDIPAVVVLSLLIFWPTRSCHGHISPVSLVLGS